jgi:hypothetical protein
MENMIHGHMPTAEEPYDLHLEYDGEGRIRRRLERVSGRAPREQWYEYTGGKLKLLKNGDLRRCRKKFQPSRTRSTLRPGTFLAPGILPFLNSLPTAA